ncbi:MAG: hypothetical protein LBF59_00405 [Prevotellaceae bacterium]|jgi:hypothetical protein|nr:hypothetical protein [Prevotellaceae bacterium]
MKAKVKKVFLTLTTAIIVASCSFDDTDNVAYYQAYGVIKEDAKTNGKLYVRSDEGKVILPSQSNFLSNENRDSRVWMMYSTDSNIDSDTIKAFVYDFLVVTQMDFKTQNDESASDDVYLHNIWVAQDYLTLMMDVKANSKFSLENHKYTMFLDNKSLNSIEEINDIVSSDTVRLEFKYDRNDDAYTESFTKIVALKLDDKIDAKVLLIKYTTDSGIKEKFVTYTK